jgi:arsenic resistance protein ArsH
VSLDWSRQHETDLSSYSKLMALEAARLLQHMGCDVRVYNPQGLPMKDGVSENHEKVQELRGLSEWSQAQFWCSPEQHGAITAVMKNQS